MLLQAAALFTMRRAHAEHLLRCFINALAGNRTLVLDDAGAEWWEEHFQRLSDCPPAPGDAPVWSSGPGCSVRLWHDCHRTSQKTQ